MTSEISSPFHFIENAPSEDTTAKPFFLSTTIPFPEVNQKKNSDFFVKELQKHWPLAEEDFILMYKSEEFGKPLRDFFRQDIEDVEFTLSEIGELVELTHPDRVRKTRSALQLGTTKNPTDVTYWQFTEVEIAQLMVGFIGRKYRNLYKRILCEIEEVV